VAWSVVEGFDEAEFVSGSGKESLEEAVAIQVGNESQTIGQALAQLCVK
jgi:hypothetical protein